MENLSDKICDWNRLKVLTIAFGYFQVPSKSNLEVDELLSLYYLKYGEPFNLISEPKQKKD